jgi:tripartite-type tricarboxylate transporter receptor subunit TctC
MQRRTALCLALLAASAPTAARAQAWPSRPVRLLVPFIPGSAPDVIARALAERLGAVLGQPVVIDNRGGAGGNIGFEIGARAAPDGTTLILGTNSLVINPALHARPLPFDPLRDFAPVNLAFAMPHMLVVPQALPAANVAELIALLKAAPDRHNYASGGNGSGAHLAGALFLNRAGVTATHVPYRGAPDIIRAVMANEASFGFPTMSTAVPLVQAGSLRALAVTSPARNPAMPDLPAMSETLENFDVVSWFALMAPRATPPAIVDAVDAATRKVLAEPDFARRMTADGTIIVGMGSAEFATYLAAEQVKWAEAVRLSGARVD